MLNLRVFTLAALAAGLLGSAGAFAQTAPASPMPAQATAPDTAAPPHHHHNRMMLALAQLDLNDDQKSKIKGIMKTYRSSRSGATPETRKQMRAEVEGVLTPDQRSQFDAQMKSHGTPAASPAP